MSDPIGSLRLYRIINVPNKPEYHKVRSLNEAMVLFDTLADRDLKDPAVVTNVFGLEEKEADGEWYEFHDEQDRDLSEIMLDKEAENVI